VIVDQVSRRVEVMCDQPSSVPGSSNGGVARHQISITGNL